jgi:hypothetical protein
MPAWWPATHKEGAEPNFKGFGLPSPLLSCCDNTDESLAGVLRPGSAGSNTAADHITVLDAAIAALPPKHRRRPMVTCDGAGASHDLITHLDKLAARPGHQVIYPVGWEPGKREKAAIIAVPEEAWQIAVDGHGEVPSAAPVTPARACAAPTAAAGSRKRTSPSSRRCCAVARPVASSPAGPLRCASLPAASGPTPVPSSPCSSPRRLALPPMGHRPARQPARMAPTPPISTPPTGCTPRSKTLSFSRGRLAVA